MFTKTEVNFKNFIIKCFSWILFLGVLPFDKNALTLFNSEDIGKIISLILNGIVILFVGVFLFKRLCLRKNIIRKHFIYFVLLIFIYFMGASFDRFDVLRLFSLFCLFGYYIYCLIVFEDFNDCIKSLNTALLFIILYSLILYMMDNPNVFYIENATNVVFKGISANRNSFCEITLLYIVTNSIINRKKPIKLILLSIIPIYATFITNSAASIICVILLLILLVISKIKYLNRINSLWLFLGIYFICFILLVLLRDIDLGFFSWFRDTFGKSSTLSGRTNIWEKTIDLIGDFPIFGRGYDTEILLLNGIKENDPHNSVLYILLTQGIIGLIVFLLMIISIFLKINKKNKNDVVISSMIAFVCVWMVRGLVESAFSYSHFVFWFVLIAIETRIDAINKERLIK